MPDVKNPDDLPDEKPPQIPGRQTPPAETPTPEPGQPQHPDNEPNPGAPNRPKVTDDAPLRPEQKDNQRQRDEAPVTGKQDE